MPPWKLEDVTELFLDASILQELQYDYKKEQGFFVNFTFDFSQYWAEHKSLLTNDSGVEPT
jgi:hypothetical protein